ncbi:MAG: hypothetical protein KF866_06405 [Phycisphaeraceae bacterium]|nr:hypothetical protein [Phycisphaeraceae bacterium]MCW5754626.1 hypothetical protein [Phycisphaeraceae bacterium]
MTVANTQSETFQNEVAAVLNNIQSTLSALTATLEGGPTKPQELARLLKLDKSLAWKVHRIMQSNDPFAAARLVPGSAGVAILADAVRKHTSDSLADAVTDAFEAFESLVERHAGDRGTFELLVSGFRPDGRNEIDISHRRNAFVGNSAILGLQSRLTNVLSILQPAEEESKLDMVKVGVVLNLRRLRPDVFAPVWRVRYHEGPDRKLLARRGEPLEPTLEVPGAGFGVPLLSKFSSDAIPPLRAVNMPNGLVDVELTQGDVGDTGALTMVFAEVYRAMADRYASEGDRHFDIIHRPYIPTEVLVQDLFIRRGTFPRVRPELAVYHMFDPALELGAPLPERYRLPMSIPVEHVGLGPAFFRSPDLPQYSALLTHVFGTVGWDASQFDLYRVRIPYPIQPSASVIRFELPFKADLAR